MTEVEIVGTCKFFDEKKGWGFLVPEPRYGIAEDIFCHYKHIEQEGFKTLVVNELVLFVPVKTSKGVMATRIRRITGN